MSIYIHRNGQQSGPFEENAVIDQLRSGQLSPNDMAVAAGGTEWQKLGTMFPEVNAPPSHAAEPVAMNVAAMTPKTGGGCRKIFGTLILITGILLTLGGFGLAIFNRVMPDHSLCQDADKVMAEVKQLTAEREAAKGTPGEAEIARKQVEKTTRLGSVNKACGDMESYYLWWFVAFLIAGVAGLILSLTGFFVRRVRKV